jgi:hypothetical protein
MLLKLGHFFSLERRALSYFYTNNLLGFIPLPLLVLISLIFWSPFVIITCLTAVTLPFIEWRKESALLAMVIVSYIIPHLLILAEPRFHLAIIPFLSVLAGYAWVNRKEIWARVKTPEVRRAAILAVILLGLLVFNWGYELARDADRLAAMFGPEGNLARFDY